MLAGQRCKENFGAFWYKEASQVYDPFKQFLVEKGYANSGPGYVVYSVVRKSSFNVLVRTIYAYNYEDLPAEVSASPDSIKNFLREHFAQRIEGS
ncbi:hypothetical protein [Pseudodesulfovibrio sediminis]|uniref:Uncharacterized protein n=1 Tax=Pseudodesulfovibrio sediminis TaxID=2810563 RepID=A0ABN6ENC4_9BACT|nr:hypothetical protein [Pseudodesulfovibrio sediminis]BCS87687.1 hypothetical protein PSDVSF_09290 [Pseudodesulfovibrio sediminis]